MKRITKNILTTSLLIGFWYIAVTADYTWLTKNTWDTLTAASWNQLVDNVRGIKTINNGNVWIWTLTPTEKLEINDWILKIMNDGGKLEMYEDDVAETEAFLKLVNAASAPNKFLPSIYMKSNNDNSSYSNAIVADISEDNEWQWAVFTVMSRANNASVINRNLFEVHNFYNNPKLLIKANGNIGIWATQPEAKLEISWSTRGIWKSNESLYAWDSNYFGWWKMHHYDVKWNEFWDWACYSYWVTDYNCPSYGGWKWGWYFKWGDGYAWAWWWAWIVAIWWNGWTSSATAEWWAWIFARGWLNLPWTERSYAGFFDAWNVIVNEGNMWIWNKNPTLRLEVSQSEKADLTLARFSNDYLATTWSSSAQITLKSRWYEHTILRQNSDWNIHSIWSALDTSLFNTYDWTTQWIGNLLFGTNNEERLRISRNWNVWIWKADPKETLHINWAAIIGNTANTCSSTNAWAVKFSAWQFQGCTGTAWVNLH